MKRINKPETPRISQEEMDACIQILHDDYHKCEVLVFNSFREFGIWALKHKFKDIAHIKKVYKGLSAGQYRGKENHVHIYAFNHRTNPRYFKVNVIHTLFHELRHYYQYNQQRNKWTGDKVFSYEVGDYRYRSSLIERDANRFAARMMVKHKKDLSYQLNIYPDWYVRGYE